MKKLSKLTSVIVAIAFLGACQRNIGGDVYTSDALTGVVVEGKIVSARQVTVKDKDKLEQNQVGGLAGGLAGGIGGSEIGKGKGSAVGAVGGAVLGALLGAAIQDQLGTQQGMEYIVQLDEPNDDTKETNINYSRGENTVADKFKQNIKTGSYKTKLISVVQDMKTVFSVGQNVFVVYNDDNRPRLMPKF